MAEIVKMPRLSDTMTDGVVSKWHKKEGDEIKVKVIDVDQQGKVKLSRKEALKEGLESAAPATT